MEQIVSEVHEQTRHFWYETAIKKTHEYGEIFDTDEQSLTKFVEVIQKDIVAYPTEQQLFWYFGASFETVGLMIRYNHAEFEVQVNMSDFEFALYYDAIQQWKNHLLSQLTNN